MASCCPEGSHGAPASHYLEAKGQMETWTLAGREIPTYIVGPADSNLTVVFVHDIFSMHLGRVKALADYLGDKGYRVVFPDCHFGDSIQMGPDGAPPADLMSQVPAWLGRHPIGDVVQVVDDCFKKVRAEGKKTASVGFCWGTWVLYHSQKAGVAMDGCVCLHPSLIAEDLVGGSHSELLLAQNCPVLVAAAGNDPDWTHPGGEWEQSSNSLGYGEKSKFYSFPEMLHGWSNRGDISDEKIARDVNLTWDYVSNFIASL